MNRDFIRPDGVPFWQFLKNKKISYSKADFPFLTATTIPAVKPVFDFYEFMTLESRGEALAYLYKGMGRSLNYVGPVLDTELPHGFNDHTDRHTLWVSERVMELLQRAGTAYDGRDYYTGETEVLATLVGMLHDVGNLLGREEHSGASMWLLDRLFMQRQRQRQAWQAVKYAIEYHEEPTLKRHQLALKEGIPLQWALVLADKMHVGRDRIGGRSFKDGIKKRAFDDLHILLECLIVRSTWCIAAGKFVWFLDFSVDTLQDKFEAFTKGRGRIWVPPKIQTRFINQGTKYRETFREMFLATYGPRVRMAAEAAGLLFPFLQGFEVRLSDTDTRGKVGNGELVVWQN
ncbi:hypothetical protein A2W24_06890 [Microgenomates group bacterium RBG_16_45_19]|nr:MAG: hypothetical protein A2W24_06890 [Microgenomates group bacterium RBG_16_45_19]